MAQTKHEIQAMLSAADARPMQRFGQNFMIDANLVRIVAEAGQIRAEDLVIEVGPGTGTLTEELLAGGANVLAVEIDRGLAEILRGKFGSTRNFSMIEGDALRGKHAVNEEVATAIADAKQVGRTVRLVANLPYNIASPLVIELLLAGVETLTFTVQKEVADRLAARPGSKTYGTLSIVVQLLSRVEVLRTLPPQAFWPMPKISSALVRLTREDQLGTEAEEFSRFVQRIFSGRRKTLRNAMGFVEDVETVLKETGLDGGVRPEEVAVGDFLRVFGEIKTPRKRGG